MAGYGEWNGSLFSCMDDCETCVYGQYCTPCLFGQNAEKIDGSNCCFMCSLHYFLSFCFLSWIPQYMKRRILRQKYGLKEDPNCPDCPASFFCSSCAICQEARFLKRIEFGYRDVVITAVVPGTVPVMNEPRLYD